MPIPRVRDTFNATIQGCAYFCTAADGAPDLGLLFSASRKKWVTMGLLDKIRAFFSGGSKEEVLSGDGTVREGAVTYFNWSKGY
jgi:hypothetical protein